MALELDEPRRPVASALRRAERRRALEKEERALWDAVVVALFTPALDDDADLSEIDPLAEAAARIADAIVAKRRERFNAELEQEPTQ